MSELDQIKARIDRSGLDGVENAHIREDYEPAGDMILRQLTDSGEYAQYKVPMHDVNAKWKIFKRGNEPY